MRAATDADKPILIDSNLPGSDLVISGLQAHRRGEVTIESMLVEVSGPRLRGLGLLAPDTPVLSRQPELDLYYLLCVRSPTDAHTQYNALIRRLVSFERAYERLRCGAVYSAIDQPKLLSRLPTSMTEADKNQPSVPVDQATYWNEQGGEKWVQNIDHIDGMIGVFNSHLLAAAAAQPGEKVLDVGCGGGTTSAAIATGVGADGEVLGVDISKIILDVARTRQAQVANLQLALGDAASFEFNPGYFDLFVSRFGVMFFSEPQRAFQNLRSALKSGGRTAFVCWRALAENPWMAAPAAAAFEILPRPEPPDPEAPGPFSLADTARLTGLLESAGFGAMRIEPADERMNLGGLENALDFFTRMGPASAALQEASETDAKAAMAAIKNVLASYVVEEEVQMPGAIWVVRAQAV